MITFIVFDMAGVLVTKVHSTVLHEVCHRFNLDYEKVHKKDKATWDKVLKGHMTETEMYLKLIKDYGLNITLKELEKMVRGYTQKIESTWELVEDLTGKYQLVVLSDMGIEWSQERDKIFKVSEKFSEIIWSYEVGFIKEQKEIFEILLKKLGGKAEECILIDDKEKNCEAAKSVGLNTIVYHNITQLKNKLKDFGVAV